MPPLPVIVNRYLVFQHWTKSHELHGMGNRFCIHDTTAVATTVQIATKVAAVYQATLLTVMDSDVTMGATDIIPLDGVSSTVTFNTASVGATGGHNTGNAMPNSLAQVVAWQTGVRGKSKRGRSFLCSPNDDMVTNVEVQALTGTAIANLQTQAAAFLSGLFGGAAPALTLEVLSRKLGSSTLVLNARADANVHTRRSRYERVPRH